MIIDGNSIAEDILHLLKEEVSCMSQKPRLAVLACAPNFETNRYLSIKKKKAEKIGVELAVTELPETIGEDRVKEILSDLVANSDGIVVQLPFPKHIDVAQIIRAIPASHDADAFTIDDVDVVPPVVGACREILERNSIAVEGQRVVVVGDGMLVGRPVARWFKSVGADVCTVTKETPSIKDLTREADIIVLGAGVPGLLQKDMIRDGVVILDAGTSEEGGVLKGDADPRCSEKASIFTPVPGGIGPITVSVLLQNLVRLSSRKVDLVV